MSMYEFICQFVRGTNNVQTPRRWGGGGQNVEPNVTNVEGVGGGSKYIQPYIYIIELNFELGHKYHNKYINYSPKYQMVRPYMLGSYGIKWK